MRQLYHIRCYCYYSSSSSFSSSLSSSYYAGFFLLPLLTKLNFFLYCATRLAFPLPSSLSLACLVPAFSVKELTLLLLPSISCNATPQRVPRWHEHVQHHTKYVARHAPTLRPALHPNKESQHGAKLTALLLIVVKRSQHYARQRLAFSHPRLQAGRRHSATSGGDDKAASLNDQRALLGIFQGCLEKGNGGGMCGTPAPIRCHRRIATIVVEGRVRISAEETLNDEKMSFSSRVTTPLAGNMESCGAIVVWHVNTRSDARVLQQACNGQSFTLPLLIHQGGAAGWDPPHNPTRHLEAQDSEPHAGRQCHCDSWWSSRPRLLIFTSQRTNGGL